MLPGRTLHGIVKQFYSKISKVKPSAKVITIEPAQNASTIECVELFSAAFQAGLRRVFPPARAMRVRKHASIGCERCH
jgi:hypothetical protein